MSGKKISDLPEFKPTNVLSEMVFQVERASPSVVRFDGSYIKVIIDQLIERAKSEGLEVTYTDGGFKIEKL